MHGDENKYTIDSEVDEMSGSAMTADFKTMWSIPG